MNQPDRNQMISMLGGDAADFFKTHVKECESDCSLVKTAQDMLSEGVGNYSLRDLERFIGRVARMGKEDSL